NVSVSVTPGVATVDVPRLEALAPDTPPPSTPVPLRTVGIAVGSVGVLGIVLGTVFGGLTFAKKGAASSHCNGMYCDAEGLSLWNSAHAYGAASTATFVIGLAAAGTGAFLFWWGGRQSTSAVRMGPTVGGAHIDATF